MESIHFVYYQYLIELTQKLRSLLPFTTEIQNKEKLRDQFNQEYKFLCDRLRKELELAMSCLNIEKMSFNDVRFTKIATHIMFVESLSEFANDVNKIECENILDKVKTSNRQINCFLKLYLNK